MHFPLYSQDKIKPDFLICVCVYVALYRLSEICLECHWKFAYSERAELGTLPKRTRIWTKENIYLYAFAGENWSLKKSEKIEKSNHNVDIEIYWQACDSRVTPQNEQTNFCSSSSCPKRNDVCLNLAQMRLPPTKNINLFTTFIKSAKINSWAMFS